MQDIRQGINLRAMKPENIKNRESADSQFAKETYALEYRKKKLDDINNHRIKVYLGTREDKADINKQSQLIAYNFVTIIFVLFNKMNAANQY